MSTLKSRRNFLRNVGAASAGVLCTNIAFASSRPRGCRGLAPRGLHEVVSGVQSYGEEIQLVSVEAKGRRASRNAPARILVRVADQNQLVSFFQNPNGLPFDNVYVQDNQLTFIHKSQRFVVENLAPREFAGRVARMRLTGATVARV